MGEHIYNAKLKCARVDIETILSEAVNGMGDVSLLIRLLSKDFHYLSLICQKMLETNDVRGYGIIVRYEVTRSVFELLHFLFHYKTKRTKGRSVSLTPSMHLINLLSVFSVFFVGFV